MAESDPIEVANMVEDLASPSPPSEPAQSASGVETNICGIAVDEEVEDQDNQIPAVIELNGRAREGEDTELPSVVSFSYE